MKFGWDVAKHDTVRRTPGFGFDYAIRIFAGPTVEALDQRHDYGEVRVRAIGEIDGRVYVVIYTDRDEVRWIITAWKASGKEIRIRAIG